MGTSREIYARRRLAWPAKASALLVAATLLPFAWFSVLVWHDCHNDLTKWAEPESAARREYERFVARFGNLEYIVVSWVGCTCDDPRLPAFAEELRLEDAEKDFDTVETAAGLIEELTSEPLNASREEAQRRLLGLVIGPDSQTAGAAITLSDEGVAHRQRMTDKITRAAVAAGVDESELRLGGPGYLLGRIDAQSVESPLTALPYSVALVLGLLWARLASLRLALLITVLGVVASNLLTGSIYATGLRINAVLSTLPTLTFLIFVSNALHLTNYFMNAPTRDPARAMRWALEVGWRPALFSGLTTGLGLLSLLTSETLPIRQFGAYGSTGVVLTVAIVLLIFPRLALFVMGDARATRLNRARYLRRQWRSLWAAIARATVRWSWAIVAVALLATPLLVLGLPKLRTSIQVDGFFREGTAEMTGVRWIEEHLVLLDSFEIVLEFPDADATRPVDKLVLVEALERAVQQVEGVETTVTLTRFTPALGTDTGRRAVARRAMVNDFMIREQERLAETQFWIAEGERDFWRLNARTSALSDVAHTEDALAAAVAEAIPPLAERIGARVEWSITGAAGLVRDVERQFLRDLVRTYGVGFVVVSVAVLVMLRSPMAGALAMIPNALPALLVFGCAGWSGVTLEVGSIMTASIALGIAVDDTLHFVFWCRRELQTGHGAPEAILSSMRHCGDAMTQTSVICGVGTAVLGACTFLPTARFGLLLSGMLMAALVADLVVLPALIALRPRYWVCDEPQGRADDPSPPE